MTPLEFIQHSRKSSERKVSAELLKYISYVPIEIKSKIIVDNNLDFRNDVVENLLPDFSITDIHLIRTLLEEEIKCEVATQRHDNLYQICYYLYDLGQTEDVFRIYDAKFNAKNMDVGLMLDREMLYLGQPIENVIEYVNSEMQNNSDLRLQYPNLLPELLNLKKRPDYGSVEEYSKFIKGYFFGHEDEISTHPAKPWWKFWK